ncbi:hypothetical protein EV189_0919 [Motilibacter rhizosphaerae]|uniref:Uncharacterized protein n=1 Tax=Motilibacter rhizosphaerae TaxID=598652 RepID=A0A4Q7NZ28_9ACTN|nr:hypothetical protein [Motilibacter rhizosphaerae]RZS91672.1 hypothetical protein EV189_0919 [Motilibacter rhizosphaerae]
MPAEAEVLSAQFALDVDGVQAMRSITEAPHLGDYYWHLPVQTA